MADIANRSRFATASALCDIYHIVRSVLHQIREDHRITEYAQEASISHEPSIRLPCHPHQHVCSPFKVKGEGEGEGELIVEMVGQVMVQTMTAVHLSRLCLLRYPPILTPHPRCLYPQTLAHHLPYSLTLTYHLPYPHTLTHHLPYSHTLTHLYLIRCCQRQRP